MEKFIVCLFDAVHVSCTVEEDEDTWQRVSRSFRELPKGTRPVFVAHQY